MNYQTAHKLKQRVFYEGYSNSIRTCPENYCIYPYRDKAINAKLAIKLILSLPMLPINHFIYRNRV